MSEREKVWCTLRHQNGSGRTCRQRNRNRDEWCDRCYQRFIDEIQG